jgi:hypothetical protein
MAFPVFHAITDRVGCFLNNVSRSIKGYKIAIMDQTTAQDPTSFFDLWEMNAKEGEDALQVVSEMVSLPPREGGMDARTTSPSTNSLLA